MSIDSLQNENATDAELILTDIAARMDTASEGDADEPASVERSAASLSSHGISAERVARLAAQAAYDKKAEDIAAIDLTEYSDVCDYFVIATGINNRQVDTIVDEIEEQVGTACSEHPFSIEGRDQRAWILMDYGSVIVHVFTPEARDYYRLENLWGDAPRLQLDLM